MAVIDMDLAILLAKCGIPWKSLRLFKDMTKASLESMKLKELRSTLNDRLPQGIVKLIMEELGDDDDQTSSSSSVIDMELVVILHKCGVPPNSFRSFVDITKESLNEMLLPKLRQTLHQLLQPADMTTEADEKAIIEKIIEGLGDDEDEDGDKKSKILIKKEIKKETKQKEPDSSPPVSVPSRPTPPQTPDAQADVRMEQPSTSSSSVDNSTQLENQENNGQQHHDSVNEQVMDVEIDVDDSDDEEEDGISVLYEGKKLKKPMSKETISLMEDDDDNEQDMVADKSSVSNESNTNENDAGSSVNLEPEKNKKSKKPNECFIRILQKKTHACAQKGSKAPDKRAGYKNWTPKGEEKKRDIHLNDGETGFIWKWTDYNHLSTRGHLITRLDCLNWTWRNNNDDPDYNSTLNLFRLLTEICPGIRHISILSNLESSSSSTFLSPKKMTKELRLPNLKSIKIDHGGVLDYGDQLAAIIRGVEGSLESIQLISHRDEVSLNGLLQVLTEDLKPIHLRNLRMLSIQRNDAHVALVALELGAISKIPAPLLQELDIGFGIKGDYSAIAAFEEMLGNFPHLKKLVIHGWFVNPDPETELKIVLKIPKLPLLEVLDMGKNYQYSSIMDPETKRPKLRKRRSFAAEPADKNQDQIHDQESNLPVLKDDEEEEDDDYDQQYGDGYCQVTLELDGIIRHKMKTLMLGALYEIAKFNFSTMPNLVVFRVASAWHLISTQRLPVLEDQIYPALTEFQFPDGIQDLHILSKFTHHFPNIVKIHAHFPTVQFLRYFAKKMLSLPKFKHLSLKTQFDFASSLNSAFLTKPWTLGQSVEEIEQIRTLKRYRYWKDFVAFHRIEVPDYYGGGGGDDDDDILMDENEEEFAGLEVLAKKLKSLEIRHLSRRLRLPKGNQDWNKAGRTLIGFVVYPISKEVFAKFPKSVEYFLFDDFEVKDAPGVKRFRFPDFSPRNVQLDAGDFMVCKKEEKDSLDLEMETPVIDDGQSQDSESEIVPSSVPALSPPSTRRDSSDEGSIEPSPLRPPPTRKNLVSRSNVVVRSISPPSPTRKNLVARSNLAVRSISPPPPSTRTDSIVERSIAIEPSLYLPSTRRTSTRRDSSDEGSIEPSPLRPSPTRQNLVPRSNLAAPMVRSISPPSTTVRSMPPVRRMIPSMPSFSRPPSTTLYLPSTNLSSIVPSPPQPFTTGSSIVERSPAPSVSLPSTTGRSMPPVRRMIPSIVPSISLPSTTGIPRRTMLPASPPGVSTLPDTTCPSEPRNKSRVGNATLINSNILSRKPEWARKFD